MEKVVYILGAGFSAPLGLPVISNFYEKSKDLYFSDTIQYKYFIKIFIVFTIVFGNYHIYIRQ